MVLLFDRKLKQVTVPEVDGTNVSIQNLYNGIRTYESLSANMDLRFFANGSGKQSLGGANLVGITLELLDTWLVGFGARGGAATIACLVSGGNLTAAHTSTGTATSVDSGTTLTDSAGRFVSLSLQTGDVLRNVTDGSVATVLGVTSETVVTHTQLAGGTGNDWDSADVWEVDTTHPVFPTTFTHVTISQDAAPVDIDLALLQNPPESFMAAAYDETGTEVRITAWLERSGSVVTSATNCTITWYNPDGTQLFQASDASPDAQGQFLIVQSQALAADLAYYATVAVTDSEGTITSRRGVPTAS